MSLAQTLSIKNTPLRDKLAQLLFVRLGSNMPPVRTAEEDTERVERLLCEYPLGGLLLFNGERGRTTQTLERLQAIAKYPLLVGADIERGVGQQLSGYTLFPHAMAFDALGDEAEEAVGEFARLTGIVARAHGIHITFAPVADVNVNPRNPIIATRAFGNDPSRLAKLVSAYVAGARAGGILATAKHFPGHGNTDEDSHDCLPTVPGAREELAACELVPFRAAIDSGVPLVMTAHVRFPAWDNSGRPATLSRRILQELLRDELKFDGAVVSDSLLMGGVRPQFADEGEMVLHAILAGVDFLLDVHDPGVVLDALEAAVANGRLPSDRVDEALTRLIRLRSFIFKGSESADEVVLPTVIEQSERLAKTVARHSIRVMACTKKLTPLRGDQGVFVVMLRPHQSHLDPPEQPLGTFMRQYLSECKYCELTPNSTEQDYSRIYEQAIAAEQLVIAMIVKPAAWQRFGLLPSQDALVRQLTTRRECVLACLGSPAALQDYTEAAERICAYSDVFVTQESLAEFLAGRT